MLVQRYIYISRPIFGSKPKVQNRGGELLQRNFKHDADCTPGRKKAGRLIIVILFPILIVNADCQERQPPAKKIVALMGGTLIDVSDFGNSTKDIEHSVIILNGGTITAIGTQDSLSPPAGSQILDIRGKYVIPGLIDGFGSMRTAAFGKAYLYEGVTSVYVQQAPLGEDGEQKLTIGFPTPHVLFGAMIGGYSAEGVQSKDHPWTAHRLKDRRLSQQEIVARIDEIERTGNRGILASYDVWPDQLDIIVREAHARSLVVLGEHAFTSYPYSVRADIDALPHNDRYQTAIALAQSELSYSDDPEGLSGAPAYRDVCASNVASPSVTAYGKQLAAAHAALMPILSIEATADDVDIPNPWSLPTAVFVHPEDLDDPVDPATGDRPYLKSHSPDRIAALKACAIHRQALDRRFHELGARFLAASGSPSYGIMPGSGLHVELALLNRIGLSPREALAAATGNFANVFGWQDVGLIERGRRADIVVLDSDPREDIKALDHIEIVIEGGTIIDRDKLLPHSSTGERDAGSGAPKL